MYKYGEEISYDFNLLKAEDYDDLQPFICGNDKLDSHIHNDVIKDGEIVDEDGLYFVFRDLVTEKIIAVVSLATSGIMYEVSDYTHTLSAIKIDVLAVDREYQKIHYDIVSESAVDVDEHYYFSDDILGAIVRHCRELSENMALADYILLYADEKACRYYERNGFFGYSEFMIRENNQEINANIPMYMQL